MQDKICICGRKMRFGYNIPADISYWICTKCGIGKENGRLDE